MNNTNVKVLMSISFGRALTDHAEILDSDGELIFRKYRCKNKKGGKGDASRQK